MNLQRKAITVFGIIAVLAVLNFMLFQNESMADGLYSVNSTIENISAGSSSNIFDGIFKFLSFTGFRNATPGHFIMLVVGLIFIFLAIKYDYEPLLLIPIGVGVIIGNIPFFQDGDVNLQLGIYQEGSVLNFLYFGVVKGIYPPLIFLGIGAMTDFSSLISNPRLMLLGAAAQVGIFLTFIGAIYLGFNMPEAGAIGIIGGADGPTAYFFFLSKFG